MSSDRERNRRSLQDLAKLAGQGAAPSSMRFDMGPLSGPASSRKEDSGLVDLKAFGVAEPSPPSVLPLTPPPGPVSADDSGCVDLKALTAESSPLSARVPPPSSAGPSSSGAAATPLSSGPASTSAPLSSPIASSVATPIASASAAPSQPKKGTGVVFLLGGLVAATAIAAGAFFVLKSKPTEAPVASAPVVTPQPAVEPAPTKPTAETAQAAPAPESSAAPVAPKGSGAKSAASGTKVAQADKPEGKDDKKVTAADLPPSGPAGDMDNAMRQAAGPAGGAASPGGGKSEPHFAPGSVPQKPSPGAITGALGAVLGTARACVGADDPISRATITFASAGNVTSVSVSGGAAGKPAEACIKAALMKAHVSPFAEASYSTPVTIRH